ncbi:MAG TPA: hypothetical protein VFQ85_10345 [Mycobacteriales bacterium]|jgi:hypothetical protein|nr:hypothetical protein [Mycobacteriales bacterium]
MRPRTLAVAALLAAGTAVPAPAHAAYPVGGACTVAYPYASTCGNAILCAPGSVVTVTVAGLGYGWASCGGAYAGARTAGADVAVATSGGSLTCGVDPAGLGIVSVTCAVVPA